MKRVLVIVVTYNGLQWIDRCLGSVVAADFESGIHVDTLVVDNGSADGTVDHIRKNFPGVELICRDDNPGFGAANNIGLALALERNYDFAYLLNQDAWLVSGCRQLSILTDAWTPDYAILSPVQKAADGSLDANFKRKCGALLSAGRVSDPGAGRVVDVPFVMAAHWLVSMDAVRQIGGFSPAFKQYGEDDNYIDRAHFHGYKVGVVPASESVHDRAQRKDSKVRRMKLKCTAVVVRFSNPCHNMSRLAARLQLIGMAVKNLSFVPLRFIPVIKSRFPELEIYREASRGVRAFL